MLIERELSTSTSHGVESSETRLPQPDSGQNLDNPDAKLGFSQTGLEFLRESDVVYRGFGAKHSDAGNSCSQELTLRYLCENSKLDFSGRDFSSKGSLNFKRKDVILESSCQGGQDRWVERDFLHLSENHGSCYLKRDFQEETERGKEEEGKDKKAKIEALKLSLALPDDDVSLSFIASSNPLQNGDPPPPPPPQPSRSLQSLAPSANNTQTTYSNDFTAASLSYSHSHPFSHNPSCSLTRNNSAENDQIWNCGEGTNGSVHSRFRPVGDGVALSNHGGTTAGVFALMNGGWPLNNKDPGNGIFKAAAAAAAAAACSDTTSFYSSELPARPRLENLGGSDNLEGTGTRKVSKPERILQEIVSESIPVMALILEDVSDDTMESTKRYLKILIDDAPPESRNNLVTLQKQLDRRSDLSRETLSKAHRTQLEVLVAIKFGLGDFVSGKFRVPSTELIEIFLLMRCRNVNCKYMLPVDDCDCKICSGTKGFCSQCMCPVCMKFDCANNTCSWVGCDVCSHWCHAACGIEKNLIRPGPSLKGHSGTTEMQFHCLGCGHASEMFGFVKDVFKYCAKDWGQRTLIKELDCVRKIFKGSEDVKGKQLYLRAEEIFSNLGSAVVSPSEACSFLIQFFNKAESTLNLPASGVQKETAPGEEASMEKETIPLPPKSNTFNASSSKAPLLHDLLLSHGQGNDRLLGAALLKKEAAYDGLEGIIRIKEAESRLFQKRADEARREAEEYRRLVRAKTEKLEEEYSEKLPKLCLQETEERRKKKTEELKILESSHCDYYNMKIRMQAEIAGLLERMEVAKQQWV